MIKGLIYIYLAGVLHVGGNLNNGSNAGVRYSNVNNSSGNANANIGSQQCFKNNECVLTPALAEKHKRINGMSSESENPVLLKHMKRQNNFYPQVYSYNNLWMAYLNARKGKKHYREVKQMDQHPEKDILALQKQLKEKTFRNAEYIIFKRNTGKKVREIYKLPFYPDRITHHAIVQVLQPMWLNLLIRDTFSTIPKRGIHDGVNRVKRALKDRNGTQYCLKMDISKYYPSIHHQQLTKILGQKIKDPDMMWLLSEIIESAPGIPIGNYISQWFGNIYMSYFDHFVKEQLQAKYYFRYADDMVILAADKEFLWHCFYNMQEYLNNELLLSVKPDYQVFPVKERGIDFLGYRFWHTHTLVRKDIVKNFKQKINTGRATKQTHSAYYGWFKHADTHNLMNKYFYETV